MQQLTIQKMNSQPYDGKFGATNKVGILTNEYPNQWLNGFVNSVDFQKGDKIFAEVVRKDQYLNFKYKGRQTGTMSQNQPKNTPEANSKPNLSPEKPDWDKISFCKCKYGFLIEAYKSFCRLDTQTKGIWDWDLAEKEAEDLASRSMRKLGESELKDFGQGERADQVPFKEADYNAY